LNPREERGGVVRSQARRSWELEAWDGDEGGRVLRLKGFMDGRG